MRQLFICKADATLTADGNAFDLTKVKPGTIGMYQNDDKGIWLAAAPESNFSIAYGRPNSCAVVLPIDFKSAIVTTATPKDGVKFKGEITIPEPVAGKDYTLQMVKLQTNRHERYSWSVTDNGSVRTTAEEMAKSLGNQLTNIIEAGNPELTFTVTVAGAKITIEGTNYQGWNLIAADDMVGTAVTITNAVAPTLDADYVKKLAMDSAQNRGFDNVYQDGASIYSGYPMEVEDTKYKMYTIRFKYPRAFARTRDEAPWQEAIIVVPTSNTTLIGSLDTILAF